jgi:two-component system, cell cycle response regulator
MRSREGTRQIPVLATANPEDRRQILRGLDLGVDDYVLRPVDRNELAARVRTQIRRKRYADSVCATMSKPRSNWRRPIL